MAEMLFLLMHLNKYIFSFLMKISPSESSVLLYAYSNVFPSSQHADISNPISNPFDLSANPSLCFYQSYSNPISNPFDVSGNTVDSFWFYDSIFPWYFSLYEKNNCANLFNCLVESTLIRVGIAKFEFIPLRHVTDDVFSNVKLVYNGYQGNHVPNNFVGPLRKLS